VRAESWQHYLRPGEALSWEGQPVSGIGDWRVYDWLERMFAAALGSLGLLIGREALLEAGTRLSNGDFIYGLLVLAVALPFIPAGIYLVFLQWFAILLAYKHKQYALTDRAAYVMHRWPRLKVKVYPIYPETVIELVKGRRSCSVWVFILKKSDGDGGFTVEKEGFENIADGERVFGIIRDNQTASP
jgi:hypothetical protein